MIISDCNCNRAFSQRFIASGKYNAFRFIAAIICRKFLSRLFAPPFPIVTPKNYIPCDAHLSRRAQWWNHLFGIARASRQIYTVYAWWSSWMSHLSGWMDFCLDTRYRPQSLARKNNRQTKYYKKTFRVYLYLTFNAKREYLTWKRFYFCLRNEFYFCLRMNFYIFIFLKSKFYLTFCNHSAFNYDD